MGMLWCQRRPHQTNQIGAGVDLSRPPRLGHQQHTAAPALAWRKASRQAQPNSAPCKQALPEAWCRPAPPTLPAPSLDCQLCGAHYIVHERTAHSANSPGVPAAAGGRQQQRLQLPIPRGQTFGSKAQFMARTRLLMYSWRLPACRGEVQGRRVQKSGDEQAGSGARRGGRARAGYAARRACTHLSMQLAQPRNQGSAQARPKAGFERAPPCPAAPEHPLRRLLRPQPL